MYLHLHLSAAFRALDHKWGKPVDLDTSQEDTGEVCVPATIDNYTTTFSSEEYLKTIRRSRVEPYSRLEERRLYKRNLDRVDSFSNISISRMPSLSDLGGSVDSLKTISSEESHIRTQITNELMDNLENTLNMDDACDSGISGFKRKKFESGNILKKLKKRALSYVDKRYRKKPRLS